MKVERLRFFLNGEEVTVQVEEWEPLLYTLRERLGVRSVKEGCGIGECGACTVLVDDKPYYSCIFLAKKAEGKHVKTVEFLSRRGLHPLQEAFIEHGAVQCGFCTPGMLLSAYSLLLHKREPTVQEIREAISGNLCRCTGYLQIVEAISAASRAFEEQPEPKRELGVRISKEELLKRASQGDVLLYAGGTDLYVRFRRGEVSEKYLDISSCEALCGISLEGDSLRIGALVTHGELAEAPLVREKAPCLAAASSSVGSPQIRNLGTLGGNIVNASPAADTFPALMVHEALCVLESEEGQRTLPLEELVLAPYKADLRKGEVLSEVRLQVLHGYKEGFIKVAKRAALSISRLSVAYAVKEKDGVFEDVRISVGAMTPRPFRARRFEESLRGKRKEKGIVAEKCEVLFEEVVKVSGMRPSYRYKFPVLRDLIVKALGG